MEIYAAKQDEVIPNHHGRRLAARVAGDRLIEIEGGHNTWQWEGTLTVRE